MNAHVCENSGEFIIRDVTLKEGILHVELDIKIDIHPIKDAS